MSTSGFGMGMIFTNSGNQGRKQASKQASNQVQSQARTFTQAPIQAPIQAQSRSVPQVMNIGKGGFRTMDLGNLKNSQSCGSCGH
jgi:hypothetical protein